MSLLEYSAFQTPCTSSKFCFLSHICFI